MMVLFFFVRFYKDSRLLIHSPLLLVSLHVIYLELLEKSNRRTERLKPFRSLLVAILGCDERVFLYDDRQHTTVVNHSIIEQMTELLPVPEYYVG